MDPNEIEINKAGGDVVISSELRNEEGPEFGKELSIDAVAAGRTNVGLPEFVEGDCGVLLSPILPPDEQNDNIAPLGGEDAQTFTDEIKSKEIKQKQSAGTGSMPEELGDGHDPVIDKKTVGASGTESKTLEVEVNVVDSRNSSPEEEEGDKQISSEEKRRRISERSNDSDPVKVLVQYPNDLTVTCKATLTKLTMNDDNESGGVLQEVKGGASVDPRKLVKDNGNGDAVDDLEYEDYDMPDNPSGSMDGKGEDVVDYVRNSLDRYRQMRESFMEEKLVQEAGEVAHCHLYKNEGKQQVGKRWPSNTTSLRVSYDPNEANDTPSVGLDSSGLANGKTVRGVGVGTPHSKNCCAKGHICFDCFPIPDELLNQLHRQTGMDKLMCLQAAQTVVKYYKNDLTCSEYFAFAEGEGNDTNEFLDETNDDIDLLFITPPKRASQMLTSEDVLVSDVDVPRKSSRFCGADKFRNLLRRLNQEPIRDWTDAMDISFVFTFFRKINKLVNTLDKALLKKLMQEDDYESLATLSILLRKEKRWSIQWEVLGVLGVIAARDSRSRRKLLESDLPVYLSSQIHNPDLQASKLGAFTELLTVLLSTGKMLPFYLLEHFGVNFVSSVLEMIEDDDSRPGWALPEVLIKLVMAYNLQFNANDVYDNLTILAIARVPSCKTLTSRLMDWLDHTDGPLTSWETTVSVHQCVIKLVTDIFQCRTTSHVFTVSQAALLVRVLIKSLPNFVPGDKRRTAYLKLIQTILRHCKYSYIRNTPLWNLENILLETSSLSLRDQDVIRSIFNEFPQLNECNWKGGERVKTYSED